MLTAPSDSWSILDMIDEMLHEDISSLQRTILKVIYGLPLDEGELLAYQEHTGLTDYPETRVREATVYCGRRSGKTGRIAANIAIYEAAFGGHEERVLQSERVTIPLIAQDKDFAREALRTIAEKCTACPDLAALLDGEPTAGEVSFKHRAQIAVRACNFRASRGMHIPVAILDEIGVWNVEGANPDREVQRSIRPGMATFPSRLLVKLSTPGLVRAGVLWDDFKASPFQQQEKPPRKGSLFWKATTREMNPAIPPEFFVEEFEKDPEAARREYDVQWIDSEQAFIPEWAIEAGVDEDVTERAADPGRYYMGAIDVAFKDDATTLAIGHREGRDVVVDCWRAWQPAPGHPLVLSEVVAAIATLCRPYHIGTLLGDQFSSEPVREALARHGLSFREVAFTAKKLARETVDERSEIGATKVDIYGAMKTLLLQRRLRLLDCPAGLDELRNLEVRVTFTQHVQVGATRGHDDYASALALVCWQAMKAEEAEEGPPNMRFVGPTLMDWAVEVPDKETEVLRHRAQTAPADPLYTHWTTEDVKEWGIVDVYSEDPILVQGSHDQMWAQVVALTDEPEEAETAPIGIGARWWGSRQAQGEWP